MYHKYKVKSKTLKFHKKIISIPWNKKRLLNNKDKFHLIKIICRPWNKKGLISKKDKFYLITINLYSAKIKFKKINFK